MTEAEGSKQQGSGCLVTVEDRPKVFYSFIYFATFLVYGASATILGAALPSLSADFNRSKSQFGLGFTSRGMGYLVGTILSAYLLQLKSLTNSKLLLTAASLLITGIATFIVTLSTNFPLAIFMFFLQGIGFGGIDTMGNCGLPEMWGKRVQPWMQAMHSCFGLGGIVGPAMVGSMGYVFAFRMVGIMSFGPIVVLSFPSIVQKIIGGSLRSEGWNSIHDGDTDQVIELSVIKHEVAEETGTGDQAKDVTAADDDKQVIAPLYIRLLVTSFFFIYVGAETGYAGWVASYAILVDVTQNKSKAAYLSAIFWALLTVGRILAIPCAVYFSAITMIRTQLALVVSGAVLVILFFDVSYTSACWVSGYIGFALSSMFPVMMTIFTEYGFAMDPQTTSTFMVGATLGESIIPVVIGVAISVLGSTSFPMSIFVASLTLLGIYLLVNMFCQQHMKLVSEGGNISTAGHSSHPLQPLHTILGEEDDDSDDDDDDEEELGERLQTDSDRNDVYHPAHQLHKNEHSQGESVDDDFCGGDLLARDIHAYLNDDDSKLLRKSEVPLIAPPPIVLEQPISSPFHESNPFRPVLSSFSSFSNENEGDYEYNDGDEDVRL